jgi:dTDP-glucose 4,6-dehydratase
LSFHASFGTPVTVVRPFNTYGPRQSARAVIPTIVAQIAAHARTIELGSLHPTRDFCFVRDTVRAFAAAIDAERAVGEVVNVATGHEISIGDLARLIAELMEAEVGVVPDARRVRPAASEVERLCGDGAKAERLLGWTPQYGGREGLRRALAETVAWFREPANLARYRPGAYTL